MKKALQFSVKFITTFLATALFGMILFSFFNFDQAINLF